MENITLSIKNIVVVLNDGADHVIVETLMPSSLPNITKQPLVMEFKAERDKGIEYVKENFKIEPEVINTRSDQ